MTRDPEHRNNLLRRKINDLLENSNDVDDRLSEGQMHMAVVGALGHEPLVFVADLLALAINAKSKMTISPGESIKAALALHDRLYGNTVEKKPPKPKQGENQMTLEFAWASTPVEDDPEGVDSGETAESSDPQSNEL